MGKLIDDSRFALRQLRKNPGFTAMVILTLALGIGATTAVFSLVDTVLLHPLPFAQPERLVELDTLERPAESKGPATIPSETSYPNFFDWRSNAHSFSSMASYGGGSITLSSGKEPARRIDDMIVSADFFAVLGVTPALGRSFTRSEEQAGSRSVILSHELWQSEFHGSPAAVGDSLRLNDEAFTVIGIMPKGFQFPLNPDSQLWITPATAMEGKNPSGKQRGWNQIKVIARLAPGVSLKQAHAEMQNIQQSLTKTYPEDNARETDVSILPEQESLVGDIQRPLRILFASVFCLLLIACANVAGLLLTRTAKRKAEFALRSALGATRMQIVRQLLIESVTVSVFGGLCGFLLAALTLRAAPQFLPANLPRLHELSMNPRIFLFALAASIATGVLFGALPAWRGSRLSPATALRDMNRTNTAGRGQDRLHSALVIGETALGLILVASAGLLLRSFNKLLSVDPGCNTQNLITFRVGMPAKRFRNEQVLQTSQQLQNRFAQLPGVQQSTLAFPFPLSGSDMSISFQIGGRPAAPGEWLSARASIVATNFFQTMQIKLLRGRFFNQTEDRPNSLPSIIINQALADRFFPGVDPLGKHIVSGLSSADNPESREIVGVVGNVTRNSLDETAQPEYYIPYAQVPAGPPVFALRVEGDPENYAAAIRSVVSQQDSTLPVYSIKTNLVTRSTANQRFQTLLLSTFAFLAMMLAATGLYAVLSYTVAQRTMELGLRLALGATRSNVLSLILKRGLTLCAIGITLGLLGSSVLTHYLQSVLFHTPATDFATYAVAISLLAFISTFASFVPAWRAAQLDPNDMLRQQ